MSRRLLQKTLERAGYEVTAVENGRQAADQLCPANGPRLALLDWVMPELDGPGVCREVRSRKEQSYVYMVLLTSKESKQDIVTGLESGADDYLTKPFQMAELLARIEALLRRPGQVAGTAPVRYQFGSIQIDLRRMEVSRDSKLVPLSAKEFQLLRYFVENRGATLSRDQLLREVWGYGGQPTTRTVDVHVAWLRQKIEKDPKNPQHILTMVGLGYKFVG